MNPSWDLFIIVFFAVVMAYSFILGRDYTLKIIIASYIATLTADGVGNLLEQYVFRGGEISSELVNISFPTPTSQTLVITKIIIFVTIVVLIAVKGRFAINLPDERSYFGGFIMSLLFGFLSAGLLVSTVLVYASGGSFMEGVLEMNAQMQIIFDNSFLVRTMIGGYSWWFSLPAVAFCVASIFGSESEE